MNATWTGAGPRILGNIDIATTVTTNGDLVAPVIKNAASLGLREISLATGVSHNWGKSQSVIAVFINALYCMYSTCYITEQRFPSKSNVSIKLLLLLLLLVSLRPSMQHHHR